MFLQAYHQQIPAEFYEDMEKAMISFISTESLYTTTKCEFLYRQEDQRQTESKLVLQM